MKTETKNRRLVGVVMLLAVGGFVWSGQATILDTFDVVANQSPGGNTAINWEVGTIGQIRQSGDQAPMTWTSFGVSDSTVYIDRTANDAFGNNALQFRCGLGAAGAVAVTPDMGTSFKLSFDFRITEAGVGGAIGFSIRADDAPSSIGFAYGGADSGVSVGFRTSGTGSTVNQYGVWVDGRNVGTGHIINSPEWAPLPGGLALGGWEHVEVLLTNNLVTVWLNGQLLDIDGATGADGLNDGFLNLNQPIQGDNTIAAATGANNRIWLWNGVNGTGTIFNGLAYVDNFQVIHAPEPSVLALLATAAGLIGLGRRRK